MRTERIPVDIIIPFYQHEELVAPLFDALCSMALEVQELPGRLILINDSPGYIPLAQALKKACLHCQKYGIDFKLLLNEENLGFLKTTNKGLKIAQSSGHDVIFLNSDTLPTPGSLKEIQRIAYSDVLIGFVSPRSNNAVHCSFPNDEALMSLDFAKAYKYFTDLHSCLPELTYVPTVVGFCMYIKSIVLSQIGFLDELYGHGYYEEYDYVFRGRSHGYKAALANHAYVYHKGAASIASEAKELLLEHNKLLFEGRYPEYNEIMEAYHSSYYYKAEGMLHQLIPDAKGKVKIIFDLTGLHFLYNKTTQTTKFILKRLTEKWHSHFTFFVLCSPRMFRYHGLNQLKHLYFLPSDAPIQSAISCRIIGRALSAEALHSLSYKAVHNVYFIEPKKRSNFFKKKKTQNLGHFLLNHTHYIDLPHLNEEHLAELFFKLIHPSTLLVNEIKSRMQEVSSLQ